MPYREKEIDGNNIHLEHYLLVLFFSGCFFASRFSFFFFVVVVGFLPNGKKKEFKYEFIRH
jgi:hypothetical protein